MLVSWKTYICREEYVFIVLILTAVPNKGTSVKFFVLLIRIWICVKDQNSHMRINELRKKNNNNKNKLDKRINWIKLINDKLRIALVFLYTHHNSKQTQKHFSTQRKKKEEKKNYRVRKNKNHSTNYCLNFNQAKFR